VLLQISAYGRGIEEKIVYIYIHWYILKPNFYYRINFYW